MPHGTSSLGIVELCITYIVPCLWCGMLWVVWDRGMPPGIRRALPSGLDGGMYVTSGEPVAALVMALPKRHLHLAIALLACYSLLFGVESLQITGLRRASCYDRRV